MKRSTEILIYKIVCVLFAAVLLFVPHRNQPYSDIRVLATVLGIDGREGNYTVSAQLAVPVAQGGDGKASTVAKASGGTMSEALEHLELGLGRRIEYGHLSTVAIGGGMTLADLREGIGYLMSSGTAGPGAYLVYCPETQASDFIAEAQKMGESSDAELSNFISYSKSGNRVSTMTALKFLQTLNSTSHAAYLPCVRLEEGGSPQNKGKQSAGEGEAQDDKKSAEGGQKEEEQQKSGGESESKKLVSSQSVAAYGGDAKDAVVLDELVTRGIVWQDPYSDYGLAELRNVQIDGEDVSAVPMRLAKKSVRRKAEVKNGENILTYTVKVKLRLDDSRICGNPLFYNKWKNALEREFESVVKSNILHAVAAAKEHNIDFLGLRDCFHKFCRKGFESFDLQKVAVEVNVKATILT